MVLGGYLPDSIPAVAVTILKVDAGGNPRIALLTNGFPLLCNFFQVWGVIWLENILGSKVGLLTIANTPPV